MSIFKTSPAKAAKELQEMSDKLMNNIDHEECFAVLGMDIADALTPIEQLLTQAIEESYGAFSPPKKNRLTSTVKEKTKIEIIHIMHIGSTLCKMPGKPQEWPEGHTRVPNGPLETLNAVNCGDCQDVRLKMEAQNA